jgi:hypothetical protein
VTFERLEGRLKQQQQQKKKGKTTDRSNSDQEPLANGSVRGNGDLTTNVSLGRYLYYVSTEKNAASSLKKSS